MIRNHLFLQTISLKRLTLPHETPTTAKSTPENPIVGSVIMESWVMENWGLGRKEQSTAIRYDAMMFSLHLMSHRKQTFAARCQMLACEMG